MSRRIHLISERELHIDNPNLHVEQSDKEFQFSLNDGQNQPVNEQFLLFHTKFDFERQASLLGDGFQMLAQTAGTVEHPVDIGRCPDNNLSYRIYATDDAKRYYNYLVIEDSLGYTLFGFSSCRRFAGYFTLEQSEGELRINAFIDGEQSSPLDWQSRRLESVVVLQGESLSGLYSEFARYVAKHHPIRKGVEAEAPVGWCSWYAYYAEVDEQNIYDNVGVMRTDLEEFEYVLLDDGYQAAMGDWLIPSEKFPSGIKALLDQIKAKGKKPAIWLAPFIAQKESQLYQQHPDWFVTHYDGTPLKAEDITYGGWRCTPWYILDTSNPEVQKHLTHVVKTMREEWGVELFKLDANYWGTLKGKRQHQGVTGVEAYRLGMEAIVKGAGDSLILGCNAPMWPSLGLVDAMRVSDDVERDEYRFEQIAKETFYRSWQHRKLWQIDPDCATFVSLANQATERKQYQFHRDALLACGGLLLSGDPLPELTPFAKQSLAKLMERQKSNQEAARFTALNLHHAFLKFDEHRELHCLFNYHEPAREVTLTADYPVYWLDYWTGEKLTEEPTQLYQAFVDEGLSSRAVITRLPIESC